MPGTFYILALYISKLIQKRVIQHCSKMWPPSDSFVLLLLPEAQAERRGWSAAETKNHNLNHKSSKGLVHLLWKLIGVFYRSETKWDLTHSSWMAARDRRAWMRLNHGSKHLWEGRFSVSFKFGEVSIFSSSLRIGFSRVVIADFGLWSLCKGGLSGGCRKGTGFKIPVFFFPPALLLTFSLTLGTSILPLK